LVQRCSEICTCMSVEKVTVLNQVVGSGAKKKPRNNLGE
jgi:hypothetical protein